MKSFGLRISSGLSLIALAAVSCGERTETEAVDQASQERLGVDNCAGDHAPTTLCHHVILSVDDNCQPPASVSIDNGSFDVDGDVITCSQTPPGPYSLGKTWVTRTCADPCGLSSTCNESVTVADTTAPLLSCPPSVDAPCGTTRVMYSVTATDNCASPVVTCSTPSGSSFAPGTTPVTCWASDGTNVSSCTFNVNVEAQGAPAVSTHAVSLWPPNHKYQAMTLADCVDSAVDACNVPIPIAQSGTITRIESDEAEDAPDQGDGHTCNDIQITGQSSFQVRAEREGDSDGRVYRVYFDVDDGIGNVTHTSCAVQVVHDQSNASDPAVESACAYCLGTGCGACPGHHLACNY